MFHPSIILDTLPQIKLKRFSNWAKKKTIKVGDKEIKLREDRQLYSKCLIIAQTRPELITKMEDLVGNYEMSIIPRTNFSPDGSMLLTLDKASMMKQIINHQPVQGDPARLDNRPQVLVVDAMPEVKALKKKPTTTKLVHLKEQFNTRAKNKANNGNYTEIVMLFDEWRNESLKNKTRAKRTESSGLH